MDKKTLESLLKQQYEALKASTDRSRIKKGEENSTLHLAQVYSIIFFKDCYFQKFDKRYTASLNDQALLDMNLCFTDIHLANDLVIELNSILQDYFNNKYPNAHGIKKLFDEVDNGSEILVDNNYNIIVLDCDNNIKSLSL